MPRQLHIEYPGEIYHLMNRGGRGEPVFQDVSGVVTPPSLRADMAW